MESTRGQDGGTGPSAGGREEVGFGKTRARERDRLFEVTDLDTSKPAKTFQKPITVAIPVGYDVKDFEVPHSLGTIPSDVIIGGADSNAVVWKSSTPWTRKAVYIRASAGTTVTLYLVP